MKIYRPLWEDGAALAPQQFQQQARWDENVAYMVAGMVISHPWGVIAAEFDDAALALARLNAIRLVVRFQDGTIVDTDLADNLPPVCDLSAANGSETVEVVPGPMKKWKSFVAGMGTMLVISALALWGWQYLHRTDPLQAQLAASLSPLPVPLSPEQLKTLRQQSSLPKTAIAQTQQQLALLDKLSPDWSMTYSRKLTEQAEMLWPEQAKPLVQQWQQQRNAAALPTEQLNGWHQGMATLEKLGHRLNGLDEQKGKYMTVSELKSVVFSAMQSFNQSIPAEEQLRRLSQYPAGNVLPEGEKTQLELHLKQLATRYAQIKQDASAQ